mgnify:CR=1 FL=1|jgi:hypothetical protein
MECNLDFQHTTLWCQACHAIEQEVRKASALEALGEKLDTLTQALELGEVGIGNVIAPPRPAPRPPAPPSPTPAPPPNPGIGYKWRP